MALAQIPERSDPVHIDLPADELEQQLAAIWSKVLKFDRVGVQDDFFDLGGDSLLALTMVLDVEKALSRPVPQSFFKQPTIRHLARILQTQSAGVNDHDIEFKLQANPQSGATRTWHRRMQPFKWRGKVRRLLKKLLNTFDEILIVEWLLSRVMLLLSFEQVKRLILWIADRPFLLNSVYRRKRKLFHRLLNSFGIPLDNSARLFRACFVNNFMSLVMEGWSSFRAVRALPRSSSKYSLDRRRLIEATPVDRLDEQFPVDGFRHVRDAYQLGRGVILLAFHGTPAHRVAIQVLGRRLGGLQIQTISHNIPLRESSLEEIGRDEVPSEMAAGLYAQVAYHGQQLLRHGDVIHILPDKSARAPGPMYPFVIGDREYTIKTGFAELALNTGAAVIPIYGRYLDDGRLLTILLPPLDPGGGERQAQVTNLLQQYARFMDSTIRENPEILSWLKIGNHFREPRARPPAVKTGAAPQGEP
jgi:lauroyl/myristoyl acyltransferase